MDKNTESIDSDDCSGDVGLHNLNSHDAFDDNTLLGEESNADEPADYLYHITTNGLHSIAVITPKDFFEKNACLLSNSIWLSEFDSLKSSVDLEEFSDGLYKFSCSDEQIKEEFDKLGMNSTEEFSKFVDVAMGFAKPDEVEDAEPTKMDELNEAFKVISEKHPDSFKRGADPLSNESVKAELYQAISDVMSFDINDLLELISNFVNENANDLANNVQYIAEHNDFEDAFYDTVPKMEESIRRGATNPSAWVLSSFGAAPGIEDHMFFNFKCDFLNGGEDFQGVVCVASDGSIKHHFVNRTTG